MIQGIIFDRDPEELWIEVHDIVQEVVIKTITKTKKCKKKKKKNRCPRSPYKELRREVKSK